LLIADAFAMIRYAAAAVAAMLLMLPLMLLHYAMP